MADVNVRYSPGRPELQVEIDRARAAERGLAVAPLAHGAAHGDGGRRRPASCARARTRSRSRCGCAKSDRARADALANITLPTPKGPVRLGDVASFTRGEGPQVIERENRSSRSRSGRRPLGRPLGDIVAEIQPQIAAIKLPAGQSASSTTASSG